MIYKDLNLLPENIKKERKSRERTRLIILISLLLLLLGFAEVQRMNGATRRLEAEKAALEQNIKSLEGVGELEQQLNDEKSRMEAGTQVLGLASKGKEALLPILESIEEATPKELFFKSIHVSETEIVIQGVAKNRRVVADFIYRMKELKLFDDVFVPTVAGGQAEKSGGSLEEQVEFSMTCSFKMGEGN